MINFRKMHGLGNDFIILDNRDNSIIINDLDIAALANRRTGIGADQLVVLEPARTSPADLFMRIFNADGGEIGACGNATRCVAHIYMCETNTDHCLIETLAGLLDAEKRNKINGIDQIAVDMGAPRLDARDIPIAAMHDTNEIDLKIKDLPALCAVNMGNPHAVFFVDNAEKIDVGALGAAVERHPLFPERTNVEFAHILPNGDIRMRVWERGAGITQACGTGACATLVAAIRRGLIPARSANVILDGGVLHIEWLADNHVIMTGSVSSSFSGVFDPGNFAARR